MATSNKISDAEWQKHKQEICRLYMDQAMPLKRLMETMATSHGFNASMSRYKRNLKTWKVEKNKKSDTWKAISQALKRRKLLIADADVFYNRVLIPTEKLRKELPRYDLPTLIPAPAGSLLSSEHLTLQIAQRLHTPDGIFIRAKPRIPRHLILELPWYEVRVQVEAVMSKLSARRRDRPSPPPPSTVLDATEYMLDWERDQDWGSQQLIFQAETRVLEDHPHYVDFVDNTTAHKANSEDEIVDASMANVLNLPRWHSQQENFAQTMAQIAPCTPERHPKETENAVYQLINPKSATRMQVLTSFMALMLANDLLEVQQVDTFVIFLDEQAGDQAFDMLSLREDPSTRAIISRLLFAAVRMDLTRLVKSALKNKFDVNSRSSGYNSMRPIQQAVLLGRVQIIRLLMDAGADITAGSTISGIRHDFECSLIFKRKFPYHCETQFKYLTQSLSSEYYKVPAFYCPCEASWMLRGCAVSAAASSRIADEIIPLLLESQLSAAIGPVVTEAICCGAGKKTVEMLLRAGASANELCTYCDRDSIYLYSSLKGRPVHPNPLSAAIKSGDAELVRLLLDYGAYPNGPISCGHENIMEDWGNFFYQSPLVIAAESGDLNIVKLLLEHGADPNWSPLDILEEIKKIEVIKWFHPRRLSYIDSQSQILLLYPIQAAASLAGPEITEVLLNNGASANPLHGTPPLSVTAYFGRVSTVDLLISRGAMINTNNGDDFEMSPLEAAVFSGNEDVVKQMILAGADLKWCSTVRGGRTLLRRAGDTGSFAILDILLGAGAMLSPSSGFDPATAMLEAAVRLGDHERATLLLQEGVNPNGDCVDERSPLTTAIAKKDLGLVSLLLTGGADPNGLCRISTRTNEWVTKKLVRILERNLGVYLKLKFSIPTLQWAVLTGRLAIVACICEAGADVNGRDRHHVHNGLRIDLTALHLAVACRYKDIIILLLARGADINCVTYRGRYPSPLCISVANSDQDITELLLRNGADPYAGCAGESRQQEVQRLKRGSRLPLECACYQSNTQMARFLISSGVDVKVGHPLSATLRSRLFFSSESVKPEPVAEIMELLITHGVDVNHRSVLDRVPLQDALILAEVPSFRAIGIRCARRLIELGAYINAAPGRVCGRTALQAAVETGDVEFVQYLLANGAEVNAPAASDFGVTALQAAAIKGFLRIAQILLEHGADIDAEPSPFQGRRAIGGAAERGRIDMVKLLLDNYDGPRPISELCASAMTYAKRNNQWYVMELLEAYKPPTR